MSNNEQSHRSFDLAIKLHDKLTDLGVETSYEYEQETVSISIGTVHQIHYARWQTNGVAKSGAHDNTHDFNFDSRRQPAAADVSG